MLLFEVNELKRINNRDVLGFADKIYRKDRKSGTPLKAILKITLKMQV